MEYLEQLFSQAVELLNEGEYDTALRYFRAYSSLGGLNRNLTEEHIKQLANLALQAGKTLQQHGSEHRARELFKTAMDAGGDARVEALERLRVMTPSPPSIVRYRSVDAEESAFESRAPSGRMWRRPHMEFSKARPLDPGETFNVRVYADESKPRPGEVTKIIELPDTGISFELEARIFATRHFRLEGRASRPFRIELATPKSEIVEFSLTVVDAPDLRSLDGRSPSVSVEFSYNGRPAGKVARRIRITGFAMPRLPKAPKELPRTRDTIAVDLGGKPADLLVTITAQVENDNRHFWCTVKTPLLRDYEHGVTVEWNTAQATSSLVAGYMRDFTKATLNKVERLAKLRGAGKELFKATPFPFKDAFWKLIDTGANLTSIAIVSDEPFIPWELMIPHRVGPPGAPPEVRSALGADFQMGRVARRSHVSGTQKIPLTDSYVVAPTFVGPRSLPHAQEEANFVTGLFAGERIDPANIESLDKKLSSCRSLLHFACHGEVTDEGQQVLYLDDEKEFSALDLCGLVGPETGIPVGQPLVFLNACKVGQVAPGLIGIGGFAAAFMELGARGVVAPLWSVKDTIAHEIAMNFYTTAKQDKSIPFAEILRLQRAKAYDPAIAEDTYAAYCFYGDPLATPA